MNKRNQQIEFDEKTHRYYVGGERKPSVTQIIALVEKHGLTKWKMQKPVEYVIKSIPALVNGQRECSPEALGELMDEALLIPDGLASGAAGHGKQVHELIEKYLRVGRKPHSKDKDIERDLVGFARWKRRHTIIPESLEDVYHHEVFDYCCRPDFVGMVDDQRAVLDWKTGAFHPLTVGMQVAANAAAVENATGKAIDVVAGIHLDDRGLPHWRNLTADRQRYFQKFEALLTYWKL